MREQKYKDVMSRGLIVLALALCIPAAGRSSLILGGFTPNLGKLEDSDNSPPDPATFALAVAGSMATLLHARRVYR
jgi:hypothetical protein